MTAFDATTLAASYGLGIFPLLAGDFGIVLRYDLIENGFREHDGIACVLLGHERILARSDLRGKFQQYRIRTLPSSVRSQQRSEQL